MYSKYNIKETRNMKLINDITDGYCYKLFIILYRFIVKFGIEKLLFYS